MMHGKKKATSKTGGATARKLPRSGLAEEVLSELEGPTVDQGGTAVAVAPTGPDQLLEFADSVTDRNAGTATATVEKLETWVTFDLAGEVFALPVTHVREILRVNSITPVPHAPATVRGVTNKRGRVLPVVDLRVRLDIASVDVTDESRILVVESRTRMLGLLVDGVRKVVRLARSAVQPPPADVMTAQSQYILGVIDFERLVILLDVDRLLVIDNDPADGDRH